MGCGVPHDILRVLNTILDENEFQNPQIFHQPVRFSPKRSTASFVSGEDKIDRGGLQLLFRLSTFEQLLLKL
jgi:hypothetical protein